MQEAEAVASQKLRVTYFSVIERYAAVGAEAMAVHDRKASFIVALPDNASIPWVVIGKVKDWNKCRTAVVEFDGTGERHGVCPPEESVVLMR
jgi:hypothetical protein